MQTVLEPQFLKSLSSDAFEASGYVVERAPRRTAVGPTEDTERCTPEK